VSRVCNEPHSWIDAASVNEHGKLGKVHVCSICGFLPSRGLMVTEEALEKIKQIRKDTELSESMVNDFADKEEASLKEYFSKEVENGLDFQKIIQAYNAGQSMEQRFIIYKMSRVEELYKSKESVHE
ncbi:MAG TPA: hypothetical protein VN855_00305, partial [Candidatus Acidoferrum sp.]|nr:hypothetical protein [Candidatus Acidoferrum sp.]